MVNERPLLPDALALTVTSVLSAAADAVGIAPGKSEEWAQALERYVAREGLFSQFAVVYTPIQPPPFFWDYNCGRCRFWKEPAPGEALGGCTIVSGKIARGGWCAVWMPPVGVRPFTWLPRLLQDAPQWLQEAPQAFANWFDRPLPPRELSILGNSANNMEG